MSNKCRLCQGFIILIVSIIWVGVLSSKAAEASHTKATLLSEYNGLVPGESFWVGVLLTMDPDWHTYWKNPGDSGMATNISWVLPAGFKHSDIYWPWPKKIVMEPLVSYGYEGQTLLMVNIHPTSDLSVGASVSLAAQVDWLECKEICLPGRAKVSLVLPVISNKQKQALSADPLFEATRKLWPTGLSDEAIVDKLNNKASSLTLYKAILLSILGGLILNLMPCVLPVLSIKVLNLINQSRDNVWLRLKHGFLYALGVLVSFWILAAFVIFFQMGGQKLGWGFQLQSPIFVLAMAVLFIVLGLNMWGLFEVGSSLIKWGDAIKSIRGSMYSFLSGVLATVVATPCTAPFMGSAMGFALSQPSWVAFLVFSMVGTGMAAPYVVLTAFPGFLRWIPKPGPWMNLLKKVMALFLFGTSLWLGWVFVVQQRSNAERHTDARLAAEPFSQERVDSLRKQGRAVFIDFTAAWCLTCQVNKRVVFSNESVIKKLQEKNVAFLVADWTHRDDQITQAINRYGRNGVPVYVLYGKDPNSGPAILPEILTPSIFIKALGKI